MISKLCEFLNEHNDWRTQFDDRGGDYRINYNQDGNFIIFKYRINARFRNDVEREARGLIVHEDPDTHEYEVVCHPFNKFFEYDDSKSDLSVMDWQTARVEEKFDGTLVSLWWNKYDNKWMLSTQNVIDAMTNLSRVNELDKSYGSLFKEAINTDIDKFYSLLNTDYTYIFELIGSQNYIVCRYATPASAKFIGCRDLTTGMEINTNDKQFCLLNELCKTPNKAPVYSLNGAKEFVNNNTSILSTEKTINDIYEGFVVVDDNFHRIKVKTDIWLMIHGFQGSESNINSKTSLIYYLSDYYIENKSIPYKYLYKLCEDYPECAAVILFYLQKFVGLIYYYDREVRRLIIHVMVDCNGELKLAKEKLNASPYNFFVYSIIKSLEVDKPYYESFKYFNDKYSMLTLIRGNTPEEKKNNFKHFINKNIPRYL